MGDIAHHVTYTLTTLTSKPTTFLHYPREGHAVRSCISTFKEMEVQSLKELCLKCIIKHFDMLVLQYESDTVPKKPFKSLQIKHSSELLKWFSKEKTYEKYMTFLLSTYTKHIDLRSCEWNIVDVTTQLLNIAETIISFSFSGNIYHEDLLLLSSQMVNLESLSLHRVNLTKDVFQTIGKFCTSLIILDVSSSYGVTDENLKALYPVEENENSPVQTQCKNSTLKSLDVHNTLVTHFGIAFILQHFPNIEFIQHHNVFDALCSIHGKSLEIFTHNNLESYNLKNLSIDTFSLFFSEKALKRCCILCPYISELSIKCVMSESQIKDLLEFTALKKLCITTVWRSDPDLTSFVEVRGKNLTELTLDGCCISTPTLLNCCPKLIVLKLGEMSFTSIEELGSMLPTHGLQHLEVLHVENMVFSLNDVSKSIKSILASALNLKKLTFLYMNDISEDFVELPVVEYACLEKLQEFNVILSDIENSAVGKLISVAPNVMELNFKRAQVISQGHRTKVSLKLKKKMQPSSSDEQMESIFEGSWIMNYEHTLPVSDSSDWIGESFRVDDEISHTDESSDSDTDESSDSDTESFGVDNSCDTGENFEEIRDINNINGSLV